MNAGEELTIAFDKISETSSKIWSSYWIIFMFFWQRQGLVTTFWLVGKEGFDKALPDPPLDCGEMTMFETLDVYYAS